MTPAQGCRTAALAAPLAGGAGYAHLQRVGRAAWGAPADGFCCSLCCGRMVRGRTASPAPAAVSGIQPFWPPVPQLHVMFQLPNT